MGVMDRAQGVWEEPVLASQWSLLGKGWDELLLTEI